MYQSMMLEKMLWSAKVEGDRQEGLREQTGLPNGVKSAAVAVEMEKRKGGVYLRDWLGLATLV